MTNTEPAAPKHPLDLLINDPTGMPPLCGEREFAELLDGMVASEAPRIFAVVQEYGDRVDARIAAWGMAFEDRADIVGLEGEVMLGTESADRALRLFAMGSHIHPRLVWVNPAAVTPADDEVA